MSLSKGACGRRDGWFTSLRFRFSLEDMFCPPYPPVVPLKHHQLDWFCRCVDCWQSVHEFSTVCEQREWFLIRFPLLRIFYEWQFFLMFSAINYAQSLLLSEKFFEPILVVIRYWCDTLPVHLHWLLRELFAVYDASKGRLIEIRRMPWWCAKDQLCAKALVLYQRTWVTRASCRCRRMKSFWSLNSASADRSILLFCSHSWSPRWSFIVLCDFLVDKLA